jgi:hypothetical protein
VSANLNGYLSNVNAIAQNVDSSAAQTRQFADAQAAPAPDQSEGLISRCDAVGQNVDLRWVEKAHLLALDTWQLDAIAWIISDLSCSYGSSHDLRKDLLRLDSGCGR